MKRKVWKCLKCRNLLLSNYGTHLNHIMSCFNIHHANYRYENAYLITTKWEPIRNLAKVVLTITKPETLELFKRMNQEQRKKWYFNKFGDYGLD